MFNAWGRGGGGREEDDIWATTQCMITLYFLKSFHWGPLKQTNHQKVVRMKSPWCNLTPKLLPSKFFLQSFFTHTHSHTHTYKIHAQLCFSVEKKAYGLCPPPPHSTSLFPCTMWMQSCWGHMIHTHTHTPRCTLGFFQRIKSVVGERIWGRGGGGVATPEKFTGRYNTYAIRYSMVLLNQIKDNSLYNLYKEGEGNGKQTWTYIASKYKGRIFYRTLYYYLISIESKLIWKFYAKRFIFKRIKTKFFFEVFNVKIF